VRGFSQKFIKINLQDVCINNRNTAIILVLLPMPGSQCMIKLNQQKLSGSFGKMTRQSTSPRTDLQDPLSGLNSSGLNYPVDDVSIHQKVLSK
jgi:hypothetical protein